MAIYITKNEFDKRCTPVKCGKKFEHNIDLNTDTSELNVLNISSFPCLHFEDKDGNLVLHPDLLIFTK